VKAAISMDDKIPREADETARRKGLSRSRLFALAVGDFLRQQRREQMLLRLKCTEARANRRKNAW
jgi:metal-responsive CopG/Arc/MetJ family transcriptional regulator